MEKKKKLRMCLLGCPKSERAKLFSFPNEKKQKPRRKEWFRIVGMNEADVGKKNIHLCERHFSIKQLAGFRLHRYDAVPDMNLTPFKLKDPCSSKRLRNSSFDNNANEIIILDDVVVGENGDVNAKSLNSEVVKNLRNPPEGGTGTVFKASFNPDSKSDLRRALIPLQKTSKNSDAMLKPTFQPSTLSTHIAEYVPIVLKVHPVYNSDLLQSLKNSPNELPCKEPKRISLLLEEIKPSFPTSNGENAATSNTYPKLYNVLKSQICPKKVFAPIVYKGITIKPKSANKSASTCHKSQEITKNIPPTQTAKVGNLSETNPEVKPTRLLTRSKACNQAYPKLLSMPKKQPGEMQKSACLPVKPKPPQIGINQNSGAHKIKPSLLLPTEGTKMSANVVKALDETLQNFDEIYTLRKNVIDLSKDMEVACEEGSNLDPLLLKDDRKVTTPILRDENNIPSPLLDNENSLEDIVEYYNSIQFNLDESMMVVSRGNQTDEAVGARSPRNVQLDEEIRDLETQLSKGTGRLKEFKFKRKLASEELAAKRKRKIDSICSNLSEVLTKSAAERFGSQEIIEGIDRASCSSVSGYPQNDLMVSQETQTDAKLGSPRKLQMNREIDDLKRKLSEGDEEINRLKLKREQMLERLAETEKRLNAKICSRIPRRLAKLVKRTLTMRELDTENT